MTINIPIDKVSTKSIAAGIATLMAILQLPQVEKLVDPILAAHPHVAVLISAVAAVAALLHNPTPTGGSNGNPSPDHRVATPSP